MLDYSFNEKERGNMTRKLATATAALLALAVSPLWAATETYTVDKAHSEASFQVRHMVSKVRGRFNDFDGTLNLDKAKPEASTVEFTIKAESINTDVPNRDKHLKTADFFDVEKYPTITFKSSKIVPKGKDQYDVTGTFTLHGVSKEITLSVTFLGFATAKGRDGSTEKAGFETSTTINRKDYGIVWNSPLESGGVLLGDEVTITINIEANKQKEKPAASE
jgi:polyisoprenoid-binding protein YceI